MDHLSDLLQPYKEQIGLTASIVTIVQFFSGSLICLNIYKNGSTKNTSAMPFIGGIVIGVMVLKYALLLEDKNMYHVNIVAIALNFVYLFFYTLYSKDMTIEVINPSLKATIFTASVFAYTRYEDPMKLEFRYGMLVTVLSLLLMGSPLSESKGIIAKKDASSIPFPLTFMGFVVSFLWLLYGIILRNFFMVVQNVLGTFLCLLQLILCFKYPGGKKKQRVD